MAELAERTCVPCEGGVPPLDSSTVNNFLVQLDGWKIEKEYHLTRSFAFPNFVTALAFVNRVGELAEQQGHHPDIYLAWGMVKIEIWTHKIKGLTESDFILAARIDKLPR